jgi:hypothetical protein
MKIVITACCIGLVANLAIALADYSRSGLLRPLSVQEATQFTGGDCNVNGTSLCDRGLPTNCPCDDVHKPCPVEQLESVAQRDYPTCQSDASGSVSCLVQPQILCGVIGDCSGNCITVIGVGRRCTDTGNPFNDMRNPTIPGTDTGCRSGT